MIKFTGLAIVALITILVFTACGPGVTPTPLPPAKVETTKEKAMTSWEAQWSQLLAEAKKEGKVMVYSTRSATTLQELGQAFKEKFGIELEFVSGRGEELARKIEAEKRAGLYLVDVVVAGSTTLLVTMKPLGILDKTEGLLLLPEVTDPAAWVAGSIPFLDKDRTAIGMLAVMLRYVLRNTDLVKEEEIKSYKDVINSKWKGKIAMSDPTVSGQCNDFMTTLAKQVWGVEETKEFMRQLVKLEPAVTREKRLSAEWVARGKYYMCVGAENEAVQDFLRLGSPIAFIKTIEGGKVGTSGSALGVASKRPHPNAAQVFVNWILSREGQTKFVKEMGQPGVRRDAPREGIDPHLFPDPGEKVFMETEEEVLFGREMLKISQEIFAPLLK